MKTRNMCGVPAVSGCLLAASVTFGAITSQVPKPQPPPAGPPAIVYESNNGIMTMNADGSGKMVIAKGFLPSFSPDGQRICFLRKGNNGYEACVANRDGTGLSVVYTFPTVMESMSNLVWSPDGNKLLFTIDSTAEDLFYIDLNSPGTRHAVPVDLVPEQYNLAISKDLDPTTPGYQGKAVFDWYDYDTGLGGPAFVDLSFDASGVPSLGPGVDLITLAYNDSVTGFAWSPDGTMLALTRWWPSGGTSLQIWRLSWQAGRLAGYVEVDLGSAGPKLCWSPDGAYVVIEKSSGMSDLFRAKVNFDVNGDTYLSDLVNLTNTRKINEWNPDWSPVWSGTP